MNKYIIIISMLLFGIAITQYYVVNKKEITGYNIEKPSNDKTLEPYVIQMHPTTSISSSNMYFCNPPCKDIRVAK